MTDIMTPKQLEALAMYAEGLSAKEIARETGRSPRTIEIHSDRIRQKTGTDRMIRAVMVALGMRLIPMPRLFRDARERVNRTKIQRLRMQLNETKNPQEPDDVWIKNRIVAVLELVKLENDDNQERINAAIRTLLDDVQLWLKWRNQKAIEEANVQVREPL